MTGDAPSDSEWSDATSGDAFGLHAIYSDGKRFDTIIMGTIDRVNDSTGEWEMTFAVDREAITSPEGVTAGSMAYMEAQVKKLTPLDQLPSYPGNTSGKSSREDTNTEDPDRLEDILTYRSEDPPRWLLRQEDDERVELLNTTPVVPLDPAKGADPEYYSLTSHGEVVRFVTGELVLPKKVLPEWVLDDIEHLQEFRDLPGGDE